ncbi:beta-Ig-H3/fasciclin, partial [Basidiobolus meristosporus CBS 931.73]
FVISCVIAQDAQKSLAENAAENTSLSTLATIMNNPAFGVLKSLLSGNGPFTVLAPSDAAFAAAQIDASNPTLVQDLLMYHVISGKILSTELKPKPLQFKETLLNSTELVNLPDGKPQVVGLSKDGGEVMVTYGTKSAKVIQADLSSSNGVIHIIDQVLTAPAKPSLAVASANLTTLVDLLSKANLVETIDGLKGATIFAPTNEALAKANAGLLNTTALVDILKYHVVSPGIKYSADLNDGEKLTTLQGATLSVQVSGGNVTVNGMKLVSTNLLTSNGVVHILDGVLIPGQQT